MTRKLPNFHPARGPDQRPGARDAVTFLNADDKLAALLPTARKLVSLQRDTEHLMPVAPGQCQVLQLQEGELVLTVPNAALATRMRHALPRLQTGLREKGWPVEAVKLKVQPVPAGPQRAGQQSVGRDLPQNAVHSFAALAQSLDQEPRNEALRQALQTLIARRTR